VTANPLGPSIRSHGPTTTRVRRHQAEHDRLPGQAGSTTLTPVPPPTPERPPRPLGELSAASTEEIAALAGGHFGFGRTAAGNHRRGMRWLLERLAAFPGRTWQQRWEAAGLNDPGHPVIKLGGEDQERRVRINAAAWQAFCMRLIQPSLAGFRATRLHRYPEQFRRIADDPVLEEFCTRVGRWPVSPDRRQQAIFDVCCALTVFGIDLADLAPEGLLHYVAICRRHRTSIATNKNARTLGATVIWPVLYEMGVFPAAGPHSLQAARTRGQRSIEELVDRHRLRNHEVRDLLVDYIGRRSAEVDYATLENLARNLAGLFWKVIEDINPGQPICGWTSRRSRRGSSGCWCAATASPAPGSTGPS
jgi:hypothetical protein